VVTGIEPTTSGLLDQRRSRSDNEVPIQFSLKQIVMDQPVPLRREFYPKVQWTRPRVPDDFAVRQKLLNLFLCSCESVTNHLCPFLISVNFILLANYF